MNFDEVQGNLCYLFENENLLIEALTHSSCLNEKNMNLKKSNEALAWLGDAIIYCVVSKELFDPKLTKECLTDLRKKFIGAKYQAELAKKYGLDVALIIPDSQAKQGGRSNRKNLHTVYEAIVGAIYRDQGFEEAKKYILSHISSHAPA